MRWWFTRSLNRRRASAKEVRGGTPAQIDELFDVARLPVFLLDQYQIRLLGLR